MHLTVRDVARLLNVSEKTVYRWLRKGQIPAYRLNDHYRFDRDELMAWASARKIGVSPEVFLEPEGEMTPMPSLFDALENGGIHYRVSGVDKPSALRAAVETIRLPQGVDRGVLLDVLMARESLASTGIGDGIAIPHARNPNLLSTVFRPMVALCFLDEAVDFGALDGQPVHALFLLVTPTVKSHLHLISRLMFALRDSGIKAAMQRQGLREEIMGEVQRVEEALR